MGGLDGDIFTCSLLNLHYGPSSFIVRSLCRSHDENFFCLWAAGITFVGQYSRVLILHLCHANNNIYVAWIVIFYCGATKDRYKNNTAGHCPRWERNECKNKQNSVTTMLLEMILSNVREMKRSRKKRFFLPQQRQIRILSVDHPVQNLRSRWRESVL